MISKMPATAPALRLRRAVAIGVLLGFGAPVPEAAGDPGARGAAQEKIAEGARSLEERRPAEALRLFEEAYAESPNPRYLYNLAIALEAVGRELEALEAFDRFLAEASDVGAAHRQDAQAARDALRARHGRIELRVDEAGAAVAIDGRVRGTTPLRGPIWISPGAHTLAVTKDGFRSLGLPIQIARGERLELEVKLAPPAEVAPPPAEGAPPPADAPHGPATAARSSDASPSAPSSAGAPAHRPAAAAPPTGAPHPPEEAQLRVPGAPLPASAPRARTAADVAPEEARPPTLGRAPIPREEAHARPFYRRWWFWSGVGAAAVAGIVTGFALSGGAQAEGGCGALGAERCKTF